MDILGAKKKVIELGKALVRHQLIARTWGNVSMRIDEKSFVITPSGRSYETLTTDEIVLIQINDLSYTGDIKPSSEKGIHASVYAVKPHVNCVIHTHQKNASALSATILKEIQLDYLVPCAEYGLPGTKTLMNNVKLALNVSEYSVIMKYHGVLCFGEDDETALNVAIRLEEMCQAYIERFLNKTEDPVLNALMALGHETGFEYEALSGHWLQTPSLLALSHLEIPLLPLLDDFAQLTGVKAPFVKETSAIGKQPVTIVKDKGAYLQGTKDELEALRIVTDKAAKAYVTAKLFGKVRPIPYFERILMRWVFKLKYSKQRKEA